jgi:hypothetical protein
MKMEEFISQVRNIKVQHSIHPNSSLIWAQLNTLIEKYCADKKYKKNKDEMDINVVLLMEGVLNIDFTDVTVRNKKYSLEKIMCGLISDVAKKKLEAEVRNFPNISFIFERFGLEIYPEKRLTFYYHSNPWQVALVILHPVSEQQFASPTKKLFCNRHNIDDQLIEHLITDIQQNPMLEVIELQDNNIGPTGVQRLFSAIRMHPGIKTVELMNNPLTDTGAKHIASVLPDCQLETLSLNSTKIGPAGAVVLAKALRNNRTITFLGMGYNQIGNEGVETFAEYLLPRYVPLNLRLGGNNICTQKAGKALYELVCKNCFVVGIDLDENKIVKYTIVEEIQKQIKNNLEIYKIVSTSLAIRSSNLLLEKIRKTNKDLANKLQIEIDKYFRCSNNVMQTPDELQANCNSIIGDKVSDYIIMFREVIARLVKLYTERKRQYLTEAEFNKEERLFRRMEWPGLNIRIRKPPQNLQSVQQILPRSNRLVLVNFKGNHILCLPRSWAQCNIKIFGDIHGNVLAVNEIARFLETDPNNKVICLGDCIDRGDNLGVLEGLTTIKANLDDPNRLILLRGNHEQAHLTPDDEEFADALSGNFHRELIRGEFEQQISITEVASDKRRCIIPLYQANTIRDRVRLSEVSCAMFRAMPLGCILPTANGKAILLTHGALFSIFQDFWSLFEGLSDIRMLLNVYPECANKKGLVDKLAEVGCVNLVCGHNHLVGSYDKMGQFQPGSTEGFIITVNSAFFSHHTKSPYACALMIKNGQIQEGFIKIPVTYEHVFNTVLCMELEYAARRIHTSGLRDLLTLTPSDQRQHIAIYAMVKAVRAKDINLAIDVGRVYLSTLKVNHSVELSSLIVVLRESKLPNSAINHIEKELSDSILFEQPKINVIKGPSDNIIIGLANLDYTKPQTDTLPNNNYIERFQWEIEHGMRQVFRNIKEQELILENVEYLKDKIGIDAVANLISNVLSGVEKPGTSSTVTVEKILDIVAITKIWYSVPIADNQGTLQFCVTIQQGINPIIEDIIIDIKRIAITHLELIPMIISGVLEKITGEINKELALKGRQQTANTLQNPPKLFTRFSSSFISVTQCLLGKKVPVNVQHIEFKDDVHKSVTIQFELIESNRLIPGIYHIHLVNTPHRTLRVDTIDLGIQDANITRTIGAKLNRDPEDGLNNYKYLSSLFKALLPPLRINLGEIERKLQNDLRTETYQGNSRIITQIIFNGKESLEISGENLSGNKKGNLEIDSMIVKEYLQKLFEERISDSALQKAIIFIITSNEDGVQIIFGKMVSDILQANGFAPSFSITQDQYLIDTTRNDEITVKYEVKESNPLHKQGHPSESRIRGQGYIEFCFAKSSKETVDVTCTGLEFRTDSPVIMEYETYRISEVIANMLQTAITEFNAKIAEIHNIQDVQHIDSSVICFKKINRTERRIKFAKFFRDISKDSIDYPACTRYLNKKGITDTKEQAHFVVLLGDKHNAISNVYDLIMQKIMQELLGENYQCIDTEKPKVTYHSDGVIEISCTFTFKLYKQKAEKTIHSSYNVQVTRSPEGTLALDKVEVGFLNKRVAQFVGRKLEKLLECRTDNLHYITIHESSLPSPLPVLTAQRQMLQCPLGFFHHNENIDGTIIYNSNQSSFSYR